MQAIRMMTWGLLGLSIAMAQPALAQERGAATHEQSGGDRGGAEVRGGDDEEGRAGRGDDRGSSASQATPSVPMADTRRVGTRNTTTAGGPITDEELELTCGDGGWIETWLEDANGNVIPGTYEYYCMDD
ncbi:hypothetical protein P6F26_10790 [Roseibacterium sp. SDUM158017]|uniref:hypothetical protein n=1 Tax=Roseicyclus salinarum TaxID=3036773 RepID=UPI00241579B8|nr:hypothetical protein [Roseibacterium sp. SDUM158017]MDG4648931.1 hypothetical protein [Roseibacterium sp. SDUM158017]